jgi:hypothetical protein
MMGRSSGGRSGVAKQAAPCVTERWQTERSEAVLDGVVMDGRVGGTMRCGVLADWGGSLAEWHRVFGEGETDGFGRRRVQRC